MTTTATPTLPPAVARSVGNLSGPERFPAVLVRPHRFLAPTFPGWGDPAHQDHIDTLPAGTAVWATSSESHGSAPWRRWVMVTADGHRMSGLCETTDFRVTR